MVEWLEVESNYKIIKGEATVGKSIVHGAGVTKIEGFRRMAMYVHRASIEYMHAQGEIDNPHLQQWTPLTCQSRWNSHFKRYKNTRDQLNNQTGFGVSEEMLAHGVTVEDMVEKACPYFYRIDRIFGEQANVQPVSHTTVPEPEEDDTHWNAESDVSLPGNDEVSPSPDETVATLHSHVELDSCSAIGPTPASATVFDACSTRSPAEPLAASTPCLASVASTRAVIRGEEKGVDKANTAKRRDFASIYTEASDKRLEFNEKRLKEDIALKKLQLEQDDRFRYLELQARERDREQQAAERS
eukprot:jgi/Phyca11/133584/e_gw1.572.3.1